ncbi:NifU family protein [Chondrinema litorale]|uniref:NifU family protein n=1 Tax=Chondrinema litorale TaxID=2994555 RepID=UPI002542FAB3|nr:NifU family protein [Chondrinema litorale]UZR92800.1 NifU family protein [Chondrinema litorale]
MATGYDKEKLYQHQVHLYTEKNPNPNSMKFMLNFMLIHDGESIDFPDAESATNSPLAVELFKFPYIKRVFYMSNFITVTKDDETQWADIIPELKQLIKGYFEAQKDLFTQDQKEVIVESNTDSEAVKKIKGVLDEYIKPAVEMDGGAIQFHSFDETNGIVKVLLQGSCSGCPSSTITLKAGIENMLKRMVPTVKEVVAEGV